MASLAGYLVTFSLVKMLLRFGALACRSAAACTFV
jgi:hypothetical protein